MEELGIVRVHCERCGASLRTLTGTLLLSAEVRESLGRWCNQCVTPVEQELFNQAVLDAVLELAR